MELIWSKQKEILITKFTPEYYKRFSGWLRALLQKTSASITFIKKDETERIMNCTLQESIIPANTIPSWAQDDYYIIVWDQDKGDWRTIVYDAIETIKIDSLYAAEDIEWKTRS